MAAQKREDRWRWDRYFRVLARIAPDAKSPHEVFFDQVAKGARGKRWFDAGCGRRSFPKWRQKDLEQLRSANTTFFGCDLDFEALSDRDDKSGVCAAGLQALPFRESVFDFVSSNMVFEHVDEPEAVVRELVRVTAPGGRLLIHTVNVRHYLALAAKLTPFRFHRWIVSRVEGRQPKDVYPTRYQANTVAKLRKLFEDSGCKLVQGGTIDGIPMNVPYPGIFWIATSVGMLERWLTKIPGLSGLRPNILIEFEKVS